MRLANVIIQTLIIFGSAFFGYQLSVGNILLIVMIGIFLFESIVMQVLVNSNAELTRELNEQKKSFSGELMSRKVAGENTADITIFPVSNENVSSTGFFTYTTTINTPVAANDDFEIQLASDKEITLKVAESAEIEYKYHSGKYIFFISNNCLENKLNKYYKCLLSVKPINPNEAILLELTAQNHELSGNKFFFINGTQ